MKLSRPLALLALGLCWSTLGPVGNAVAEESARVGVLGGVEEAHGALNDERFLAALELTDPTQGPSDPQLLAVRSQTFAALGFHSLAYWLSQAASESLQEELSQAPPTAPARIVLRRNPAPEEAARKVVSTYGQSRPSEGWRVAADRAWLAGDCHVTAALAAEWALYYPDEVAAHRLKGDAHRCTGAPRAALESYEEVTTRGAGDSSLELVIEGLESSLGVIDVDLTLHEGRGLPTLRLRLPGATVEQVAESTGPTRFVDVPWGQRLLLQIAGSGYESSTQWVSPLMIGETRSLEVELSTAGFGTVSLSASPSPGVTVFADDAGTPVELSREERTRVTSGTLPLLVSGPGGTLQTEVTVAEDQHHSFDPLPWVPTSVRLSGLPAGATLRVFVEGQGEAIADHSTFLVPGSGTLDAATGVHVSPPLLVRDLVGGTGGLFVEHSVLGDAATVLILQTGASNAVQFRWRSMTGVPQVAARYSSWQEARTELLATNRLRTSRSFVATVIAGGLSAVLFAGSHAAGQQLDAAQSAGITAARQGDVGDLHDARAASQNWSRGRTALLIGAGAAAAGVAVGAGITFSVDRKGRTRLLEFGEWSP